MGFTKSTNGVMKLLVQFEKPFPLTLDRVGTIGLTLNVYQKGVLHNAIQSVKKYDLELTNYKNQNTLGIIYLDLEKGALSKIKYVNIDFVS